MRLCNDPAHWAYLRSRMSQPEGASVPDSAQGRQRRRLTVLCRSAWQDLRRVGARVHSLRAGWPHYHDRPPCRPGRQGLPPFVCSDSSKHQMIASIYTKIRSRSAHLQVLTLCLEIRTWRRVPWRTSWARSSARSRRPCTQVGVKSTIRVWNLTKPCFHATI